MDTVPQKKMATEELLSDARSQRYVSLLALFERTSFLRAHPCSYVSSVRRALLQSAQIFLM